MKKMQTPAFSFHPGRHRQIAAEKMHDPYQQQEKPGGPALCERCGAVYGDGKWQWTIPVADAALIRCPACRRIHDKRPAGYVSIGGAFLREHHDDIANLIRRTETREKAQHPLKRIMAVNVEDNTLLVETTDAHLARSIGEALEHAYKGDLRFHYNEADHLLWVRWQR